MASNNNGGELEQNINNLGGTNQINKENTTTALTETIKYIIDKLLLKEQKISKEDREKFEKLLSLLNDIKSVTEEYSEFFDEHNDEIKELIDNKEKLIVLSNDLSYNYDIINDIYDFLDKRFIKLLESLSSTKNFFKLSNFGKDIKNNKFNLLLKDINTEKSPEEKLHILETDLKDLEQIVHIVNNDIQHYSYLLEGLQINLSSLAKEISMSYLKTGNFGMIYKYDTGNVSFEYKKSEVLTFLFNTIIEKLPNNYTYADSFKKDLITIFSSEKYNLISEEQFITPDQIKLFKGLHTFYKKLSKRYKKINDTIEKIYEKNDQKRFTFDKIKDKNNGYKILDIFEDNETRFLENIDKLTRKDKSIYKVDKENKYVGSEKARKFKEKIFDLIYSIYSDLDKIDDFDLEKNKINLKSRESYILKIEDLTLKLENNKLKTKEKKKLEKELIKLKSDNNISEVFSNEDIKSNYIGSERFNKKIFNLIKLKIKYEKLLEHERKKEKNIEVDSDKKFTNHYTINSSGQFGGVSGFDKKIVEQPAKVVGKTARQIIDNIKNLAKNSKKLRNINKLFPGSSNTLEGNLIVLGPWGGGKTALLNELSYEKNLVTVEVNKSDILSTWYGQTEANIDMLWKQAYKLHKNSGLEVFIFLDEFDNLFKGTGLSGGGGPDIQKELQTRLDGLEAFDGVHMIGLSNVPHKIPIDIYRRMEKTFVLEEIDLKDKVDLFYSRLDQFPISNQLKHFLSSISEKIDNDKSTLEKFKKSSITTEYVDNLMDQGKIDEIQEVDYENTATFISFYAKQLGFSKLEEEILKGMYLSTPKILYQVTERFYKNYIDSISKKQVKEIEKGLKEIKNESKIDKRLFTELFKEVIGKQLCLKDFKIALDQVFSNESVAPEIKGNAKFYKTADKMLKAISSNAFNGFDDDEDNFGTKTIIIQG